MMTGAMRTGLAVIGLLGCGTSKADVPGSGGLNDRAMSSPATRTLATGATIDATTGRTITSRSTKPGETVMTTVEVAVGTAIGAVAGRVIGGNTKGAVIGGAVGAAGGTVVAIETASRDVVVSAGTPVTLTLTGPLTVASN